MVKFLRRDCKRFSKFGNGKGKKASWRKPKGRDNKMREKKRGYPAIVSIGYGTKDRKKEIIIKNIKDLLNLEKGDSIIVGSVGKKNKIEIVKKAEEMKLNLINLNPKAFLKKLEKKQTKEKMEEKKTKENKK